MRAPEAPIGWPSAIAPPFTFTRPMSKPRSRATAQDWAAKASFDSTRSMSSILHPALSSALRLAGIGPAPISAGSMPAVAQETMRPSGRTPRRAASSAVISTSAAAPSLMPDALPAVTVPSLAKAGRSFASASTVVPWRGYSSVSTTMSPLRLGTVTAAISSARRPSFCASSALAWLAAANASCSLRPICHFSATFSAVFPMW